MPQISKSYITVGNRGVGSVWVDGGAVRGESGALQRQVVVPLTIAMQNTPSEAMLAVVAVRAQLQTQPLSTPDALVAQPVSELLMDNFPARSLPVGSHDHVVELRFFLTSAELETLERHRHAVNSDPFQLYLRVEPVVAGLKTFNRLEAGGEVQPTPWEPSFGMFSQLLPFWSTKVDPVTISIERSKWVREVLPGLGYERSRLIEISFPPPLPDHPSAASEWDKARRAFDEQRYADCVSECRDILSMWQRQLGTKKDRRVADAVAERRGWGVEDGRLAFLDAVWKATTDLVNVPHHPEGQVSHQTFDAADARLLLLMTASLSAYLRE
jgi:hypothetical protein